MELSLSNIKKFLVFFQEKDFPIFRETESPEKFLIFQETETLKKFYISGSNFVSSKNFL